MIRTELWNPIDDILGEVGNFFSDVLRNTVSAMIQGVTEAVKWVSTYFLYLPAPVLEGEGDGWSPAERVQAYTDWAVVIVGMVGLAFALIVVARRKDADSAIDVTMGFFRVILVAGAAIPALALLTKFFDEASPWLINNISGGTFEDGMGTLYGADAAAAAGMGTGTLVLLLVALIFGVLGGILNLCMVMFNWGVLPVVAGLLPVMAAFAMTSRGKKGFDRVLAWTAAIILFKPVAAIIYGVGLAGSRMISGSDDSGQVVLESLYATVLLIAAGIALPAIARIVAPAVAAGTQGGGMAFLSGAAMVAVGAISGGAAAVAAAGARTAAAPAAMSTQAAQGAASTSVPAAGGSTAGSSGGGSGGGGSASGPSGSGSQGSSGSSGGGSGGGGSASGPSGSGSQGSSGSGGGGSSSDESADVSAPVGASAPGGGQQSPQPASRGSDWARKWAANGAAQAQMQVGSLENAMEAGDER